MLGRFIAMVTGVLAIGTVAATSASAAAVTDIERYHVDLGTEIELSPPCTDEPIRWTGGYDVVVTSTQTANGSRRSLHYRQQLTGTGVESGSTYVLNAEYHELVKDSVNGADVTVIPQNYVQISRDGTPNYLAHGVLLVVVTPQGLPVVDTTDEPVGFVRCVG